jgi:hypothetical protein
MILKTFAYTVGACDVCEELIIYKIVDGVPSICPFCGASGAEEIGYEEAIRLRRQKERAKMASKRQAADPFFGGFDLGGLEKRRIFVNGVEVDPNELRGRGINL